MSKIIKCLSFIIVALVLCIFALLCYKARHHGEDEFTYVSVDAECREMEISCYSLFQLDFDPNDGYPPVADVKKAFRQRSLEKHPDVCILS